MVWRLCGDVSCLEAGLVSRNDWTRISARFHLVVGDHLPGTTQRTTLTDSSVEISREDETLRRTKEATFRRLKISSLGSTWHSATSTIHGLDDEIKSSRIVTPNP